MTELIRITHTMDLAWTYGTSWYFDEFIRALRDDKAFKGLQCSGCRRVYLPPRPVCGNCHLELHEWVDVKDTGVVVAYTTAHLPLLDPTSGEPRPSPQVIALIRLEGAHTTINHFLEGTNSDNLQIGLRVQAVWQEERKGDLSDITHFEPVKDED